MENLGKFLEKDGQVVCKRRLLIVEDHISARQEIFEKDDFIIREGDKGYCMSLGCSGYSFGML